MENETKISIHEKISQIQIDLLKHQFKTKKGFHSEFIPLEMMLPPVLKECNKHRLTLYFTATLDQLVLKLVDWDNPKEEFGARVRLPEMSKDEKDEGKKITYLKRYLLMDVFMIIEESVDPDMLTDKNEKVNETSNNVVENMTDNDKPLIVQKIIKECKTRNKPITPDMVNLVRKEWFINKEINTEENSILNEYIKELKAKT